MRRLSAATGGGRQPEGRAHGTAHPRVMGRRRRPGAVIEAAENHQIGMEEPRLEGAEDGQPRVPAVTRPHHERLEKGVEEGGISRRFDAFQGPGIGHRLGKMRGQRLARLAAPEPRASRFVGRRRKRLGGVEMARKQRLEGHRLALAQGRFQRREEGQKILQLAGPRLRHAGLLQRLNERLRTRRRGRTAQGVAVPAAEAIEVACQAPKRARRPTGRCQGMLHQRQQPDRRETLGGGADEQAQKASRLRGSGRRAGRVVDGDPPAFELALHQPGKGPIRCHEGGRPARRLEGLAQEKGDRARLFVQASRVDAPHAGESRSGVETKARPVLDRFCGTQGLGEEPRPRRPRPRALLP